MQRLFRANGWQVTSDVHLGDWGLQMGQLISEIEHRGIAPVYFDADFKGPYPEQSPVTMDDLEEIYPAASAACKADPARLEEARKATAELQGGRPGYRALWNHFFEVSRVGLEREWGSLGVHFDLWKGEASVDPLIAPMIADLKARHIAQESEGALVIPVARDTDKKEMPPLILVKSDGAVLYGTTDLATIIDRVKEQNPDLVLYVVDQRQHLHFEQVFRAAHKAQLDGKAELEHAGFGTMNGPDGKPFKTRAGGVMKLYDLIAMATEEAEKRLTEQGLGADYSKEERAEIARKVGIATIKFADLSNHRQTDYIFDLARFSRFEGKTGPYLQYAAVRIQSILRQRGRRGIQIRVCPWSARPKNARWRSGCCRCPMRCRRPKPSGPPTSSATMPSRLAQDFSRFLFRTPHPVRIGCGTPGRPIGSLPGHFGHFDKSFGPFGHRSSSKDVSKTPPCVDSKLSPTYDPCNVSASREGAPQTAIDLPRGRDLFDQAPKEQPPRKLSGKRTAQGFEILESGAVQAMLTEGVIPSRAGRRGGNLSGPMTEGLVSGSPECVPTQPLPDRDDRTDAKSNKRPEEDPAPCAACGAWRQDGAVRGL